MGESVADRMEGREAVKLFLIKKSFENRKKILVLLLSFAIFES